jgi:dolichyl-phosphate-mannose--protein O-mannosyl transferase
LLGARRPAFQQRDLSRVPLTTTQRLRDFGNLNADNRVSWIVTIGLMVLAFAIRFPGLGFPNYIVFDETYYAKDAFTQMIFGYPTNWAQNANNQIASGITTGYETSAEYAVHPMLGKWIIAIGIKLFGMNAFGWRFMSLIFGCLLVGITIRMARRLSRSTLVGAIAGFLLCVDGLSFVMSRIALLDVFEAFFTVAAVSCVIADRDWFRDRLASYLDKKHLRNLNGQYGPLVLWRPWRLTAGIMFGLACGVKWNAMYVLAVMGIISVIMDFRARRAAGARNASWGSIYKEGLLAFVYLVLVAVVVYVATWSSYLYTTGGYLRDWGWQNPGSLSVKLFGAPLASLWHYHVTMFDFHTGSYMAHVTHPYAANPAGWWVIGRTIGIDAVNGISPGQAGCDAAPGDTCLRVISGMGTPILWWLAAAAMIAGLLFWIFGRDWRFAIPVIAAGTTWIGWFPNDDRPLFFFYAIMMIPFSATVLAMCLGKILGPAQATPDRHRRALFVGVVIAIIVLNFAFIYPILTDTLLTRTQWSLRMWFRSWI